jgi:hypothetical protein
VKKILHWVSSSSTRRLIFIHGPCPSALLLIFMVEQRQASKQTDRQSQTRRTVCGVVTMLATAVYMLLSPPVRNLYIMMW